MGNQVAGAGSGFSLIFIAQIIPDYNSYGRKLVNWNGGIAAFGSNA